MIYFFIWSFQEEKHCSSEVKKAKSIDQFLNQLQLYHFFGVFDSYNFLVMTTQIFTFLADNQVWGFYNTRI